MKKILMILCALSLVLSCTDGKVETDSGIPPHLQGGTEDQEPEEDSGDYPLEPDNPDDSGDSGDSDDTGDDDVILEDTWAENQPTGAPMTVCLMSYNVGNFTKYQETLGHMSYPEVAECIEYANANVIGLNEVNKGRESSLVTELGSGWSSYFYYAKSSNYGNAIVYDKSSAVVNREFRVNIPKTADAGEQRSMGAIEFEDFVFCVTHLDHKSDAARKNGAEIITDWVRTRYGYGKTTKPVFLVGDMNCNQNNSTIKYLEKYWTRISAIGGTFQSSGQCIDFVFVFNNGIKYEVGLSQVVNRNRCSVAATASDHYGVFTEVTFNRQK